MSIQESELTTEQKREIDRIKREWDNEARLLGEKQDLIEKERKERRARGEYVPVILDGDESMEWVKLTQKYQTMLREAQNGFVSCTGATEKSVANKNT